MKIQALKLDEFKDKLKELKNPWRDMSLHEYLIDEFYSIKKVHINFMNWQATRKLMTIQEHNEKYGEQHYNEDDDIEYLRVLDYNGSYLEVYKDDERYESQKRLISYCDKLEEVTCNEYGLVLDREYWEEDEDKLVNLEIRLYVLWVIHETNESDKYKK